MQISSHFPCGVLGLLDLLVLKDRRALVEGFVSLGGLARLARGMALFCTLYVCLLHVNYSLTRAWPYSFMVNFGRSPVVWAQFVLGQVAVFLVIFLVIVVGACQLVPAAW